MKTKMGTKVGALLVLLGLSVPAGAVILNMDGGMSPGGASGVFKLASIGGSRSPEPTLTKEMLSKALKNAGATHDFPSEIQIDVDGHATPVIVQYAFDPALQSAMEGHFRAYRPDYGAFVAIDPQTGRVLSMVSYTGPGRGPTAAVLDNNFALRATFPSASVFKVVTAAAAIAEKDLSADSVISFTGRNHTLYKSAILKQTNNRWTRHMSLKEAFARSVNTVFGRLGAFTVGADELRDYALRFGFNRAIAADVPVQAGRAVITDDPWALAETASGYTLDNTMSPLQGALIASAIANDGQMMEPYVVQSVHGSDGGAIYNAESKVSSQVVDKVTASQMRKLMAETVAKGTSRKAFRGFFKKDLADLEVGGKTGSLTGMDPPGKYDWFVGYAQDNAGRKIAVAALTINERVWRVKSSYLARLSMESYFKRKRVEDPQFATR